MISYYSAPVGGAEFCHQLVCLYVCLSASICLDWGWGDFGAPEPKTIGVALQMSRHSISTYLGAL